MGGILDFCKPAKKWAERVALLPQKRRSFQRQAADAAIPARSL